MTLWIFLGIGSGALFSLLLSNFFNFVRKEEKPEDNDKGISPEIENNYDPLNYQTIGSFFVIFGYSGAFMYENDIPTILTVLLSSGFALVVSFGIFKVERYVKLSRQREKESKAYLIGAAGLLTTEIKGKDIGQVEVSYSGQTIELTARTLDGKWLTPGTKIIISDFDDEGIALVSDNIPI
jgi:hypothetical protein